MPFIRIYPLKEVVQSSPEIFGSGEPARCTPESGLGRAEFYLNADFIYAFEECPLYLVTRDDPNLLTDGIRILMHDGKLIIVQDDTENQENSFKFLLKKSLAEGIAEMNAV